MKRMLCLILTVCLLGILPSCAENSINNDGKLPQGTAVTYGSKTNKGGFLNFISQKSRNQKPKITKYVDISDIEFDLDFVKDPRSIETDAFYGEVDEAGRVNATMPIGNFLVDEDGFRKKLCTNRTCRKDEEMYCTHLNLSGGIVDGRYVYYIGKYRNDEPVNYNMGYENSYTNYLMRYDIRWNRNRVMLELPWWACIVEAAHGVLYIGIDTLDKAGESVTARKPSTVVYDLTNHVAAEVPGRNAIKFFEGAWVNGWMTYGDGRSIVRIKYDLSERRTLTYRPDHCEIWNAIGTYRNRTYLLGKNTDNGTYFVLSVDDSENIRVVYDGSRWNDSMTNHPPVAVYGRNLYVLRDNMILRYKLALTKKTTEEETVVFDPSVHGLGEKRKESEYILWMELRDTGIFVETKQLTRYRSYLVTPEGVEYLGSGDAK